MVGTLLDALQLGLGFLASLIVVSVIESVLHDHIHHARAPFRVLQSRYPRLLGSFREAFRSHSLVHHGQTFPNHIDQFVDEIHKRRVDSTLQDRHGARIIEERYGATINFRSTLLFMAPTLPFAIFILVLPWPALIGAVMPIMIYPLMSKVIHPYLHKPYSKALRQAPPPLSWILRSKYLQFVWRHHWIHHQVSPRCNFNLLPPIGDALRGKLRLPTTKDLEQMRSLGLPVSRGETSRPTEEPNPEPGGTDA